MKIRYRVFRSAYKSWEELFEEAAAFAGEIPHDCLVNISHSCDHNNSVVTVWYWGK